MKDELGRKIMPFASLKPKTYSYLTDDNDIIKNQKANKSLSQNENLNLKIMNIA